jgi:ribosomal protein S18 acetylase RimI-like enzyme
VTTSSTPTTGLSFATTDEPAPADTQIVDAGLDAYSEAAAPLDGVRQLAAFARDAEGRVVGGAVGRTWGRCCELLELWVEERWRRAGVGSRLLRDFEAGARTRGCSIFYLTTLSFQAPGFYRRHGYDVLARIEGYPDDIVKYLMHKREG